MPLFTSAEMAWLHESNYTDEHLPLFTILHAATSPEHSYKTIFVLDLIAVQFRDTTVVRGQ